MDWQPLAELVKRSAVLPKETFLERYATPFLLEVSHDDAGLASEDTRDFKLDKVLDEKPTLDRSRILEFGAGDAFCAGRGGDADVRCPHDSISERHCLFERIGTLWALRDAGSKNGTFLGNQQVGADQIPLKFGSKLRMGEAQYLFLSPEDCFDLVQDLSKEPRIRPRSMGKYRAEFQSAGTVEDIRKDFPGPFLVVQAPSGRDGAGGPVSSNTVTLSQEELTKNVNKNVADAVFNLSGYNLVRIGRATVTQIHLPLGAISNLHAALVRDGDDWFVQDLGAKNGTYVWGEKLGIDRKKLESGSELTLGNIKSIFFNIEDLITYVTHRDTLV